MTVHSYHTSLTWSGDTEDYETYSRHHQMQVGPAPIGLSSDPAFKGDPQLPNPELLLVASASSCQLLSFLAIAARSGVHVVEYGDEAEAEMPESARPIRITAIRLRPRVVVQGSTVERVRRLLDKAHEQCYVANTLNCQITLDPFIEII